MKPIRTSKEFRDVLDAKVLSNLTEIYFLWKTLCDDSESHGVPYPPGRRLPPEPRCNAGSIINAPCGVVLSPSDFELLESSERWKLALREIQYNLIKASLQRLYKSGKLITVLGLSREGRKARLYKPAVS